jgi:alpha-tubulin suppressor-like RCC1 family protein
LTGTFTQVLARNDTSYALRSDGTVWAWGYNGNGQLGRNLAAGNGSGTPAQVVQLSNGQPLTGIVGLTASEASFSGTWVLAWTATGVAWKWGLNFSEPGLGGNPGNNILAAVPHIYFDGSTAARSLNRAVAGGLALLAYIDGTGTAGFWTCNFGGCSFGTTAATAFSTLGFVGAAIDIAAELGDRVVLVRSDNTLWGQAYRDTGFGIGWDDLRSPLVQLALPEGVTRVAVGRSGTVTYAVGLSGAVYAAGDDSDGQLGDGSAGGRRTTFAPVLGVNDATLPSVGSVTGHALRGGGAIWAWGNNYYRINGTTDSANRPVGSPGWLQIEATAFATRGR